MPPALTRTTWRKIGCKIIARELLGLTIKRTCKTKIWALAVKTLISKVMSMTPLESSWALRKMKTTRKQKK